MKTDYPANTKRTYPIDRNRLNQFLQNLLEVVGFPFYYEELLLYIEPKEFKDIIHFRISLTREGFRWNWYDERHANSNNEYSRTTNSIRTGVNDIKEKLTLTASTFGNTGTISVAKVYKFTHEQTGLVIELRPDSLIGPIASTIRPIDYGSKLERDLAINNLISQLINPFKIDDLLNKTNSLINENEEYLILNGSGNILHPTILDFCQRNGIVNPFRQAKTYKQVLEGKHNDYGVYEDLFKNLTNIPLLSKNRRFEISENLKIPKISVIIPCFNTENTINRTLHSISSQKLPEKVKSNLEIILIDDGSTYPVEKFIKTDQFPFQIQVVRINSNHGVSNARLIGVTQSSGEILIFLDSDLVLSEHYISDHAIRNLIISNAVFVSFKENVDSNDKRISEEKITLGASLPNYGKDLRIFKKVSPDTIGSYEVREEHELRILEETNHFKRFHGSQVFGVYDLSCMVTGHNFSIKRDLIYNSSPFDKKFKGWGMEDVYFGLKMICNGNYIIPVMSSGVYHINHEVRLGGEERKRYDHKENTRIINDFLNSIVE